MKFNKFYSCVLCRESCHKEHKSLVIPMKNVPLHNAFFFFFGLTMKQKTHLDLQRIWYESCGVAKFVEIIIVLCSATAEFFLG